MLSGLLALGDKVRLLGHHQDTAGIGGGLAEGAQAGIDRQVLCRGPFFVGRDQGLFEPQALA
jgi:hypothetical protein